MPFWQECSGGLCYTSFTMKVLALSDITPQIDILAIIRDEAIELVITLGDFDREELLPLERVTTIPKIGVYGNHDSGNYMPELGIWDMHLKLWDWQGLKFGGFQGCVRYKDNPDAIMYTQDEARQLFDDFPPVDIFLSHCPPYGINDEPTEIAHQGFMMLREYLNNSPPKVWLHGHTYPTPDKLITQQGPTRIEYVYGHKLLEL